MRKILTLALLLSCSLLSAKNFRVAIVGDPQVNDEKELAYARRSIYKELRERKDLDMVLILGDLVNDKLDNVPLLEQSVASLDSLNCPWFSVPGNHDRDRVKGVRGLKAYRRVVGYVDTSFVYKGVRFILMNNISERTDYDVSFTPSQTTYLDSLLRISPKDMQVVLATHAPVAGSKGLDSLKTILSQHPRLLLASAHTHNVKRTIFLDNIEDLGVGTSCGSWWRGVKGEDGIPYALMNCGAPRGYFIADFGKRDYRLKYEKVGKDKSEYSIRIVDNNLIINVFGGAISADVNIRLAGKSWMPMRPYDKPASEVADVIEYNSNAHSREYRRAHKDEFIPLRRLRSPHVWYIPLEELSSDTSKGLRIKLDYSDPHYRIKTGWIAVN